MANIPAWLLLVGEGASIFIHCGNAALCLYMSMEEDMDV